MFLEDGTCDASIPAGSSGNDQELFDKYGKVPFIFGWHEIRQLLFDHLPDGIVHFDTQVHQQHWSLTLIVCQLMQCMCTSSSACTMYNLQLQILLSAWTVSHIVRSAVKYKGKTAHKSMLSE